MLDTRSPYAPEVASLAKTTNECLSSDVVNASLTSVAPFAEWLATQNISENIILDCTLTSLTDSEVSRNDTA